MVALQFFQSLPTSSLGALRALIGWTTAAGSDGNYPRWRAEPANREASLRHATEDWVAMCCAKGYHRGGFMVRIHAAMSRSSKETIHTLLSLFLVPRQEAKMTVSVKRGENKVIPKGWPPTPRYAILRLQTAHFSVHCNLVFHTLKWTVKSVIITAQPVIAPTQSCQSSRFWLRELRDAGSKCGVVSLCF